MGRKSVTLNYNNTERRRKKVRGVHILNCRALMPLQLPNNLVQQPLYLLLQYSNLRPPGTQRLRL